MAAHRRHFKEVPTDPVTQSIALAGTFAAGAFALVRSALKEHRAASHEFTSFLQGALARQEEANRGFTQAIDQLSKNIQENTLLMGRFVEKL